MTKAANQYVEGTAESSQILQRLYPRHLYDPTRRSIAVEIGGKEIAKLLDVESARELRRIRESIDSVYDKRADAYAPIHDFWSFIEMILHVKKKELPELLTAENVTWSTETLSLDQLELTWMPFLTHNQDIFGKKPWKIADLQRIFAESPELLDEARKFQAKAIGKQQHKFKQSDEPITVIRQNGTYKLVDGNGRIFNNLLAGGEAMPCYIGTMRGETPINYWVSSCSIKQMCLAVRGYTKTDPEGHNIGVRYLNTILRNNETALINYHLYLRDDFPEFEEALKDILPSRKV